MVSDGLAFAEYQLDMAVRLQEEMRWLALCSRVTEKATHKDSLCYTVGCKCLSKVWE